MLAVAFTVLFWVVALSWVIETIRVVTEVRSLRRLPSAEPPGTSNLPTVSVVIAARDEETRVETTVRRLLAQEGVRLQVIVADDRSADGTGKILQRLGVEDARVKPVRIDEVPEGWLGKCYACHRAAQAATGEWILFTDADVWMAPDVLARAVRTATSAGADHLTMVPGVEGGTLLGKACRLVFFLGQVRTAARVNRDRAGAYVGMGAFNLVRAEAYQTVGGYESLRLSVLDDFQLGLLLRRAGYRSRLFVGHGDLAADWAPTLPGLVKALEKNHFAVVHFRLWPVVVTVLLVGSLWAAAMIGPWSGSASGVAAGLALISMVVPAGLAGRRFGWPLSTALLTPFVLPVLVISLVNSTLVTLWHRGVWWRDTFYPLTVLRAGSVR